MKRLLVLAVLGTLLGVAGGCRVGECWTYAWNSRFHPERNVRMQPCVMADPCSEPSYGGWGGETVVTPGPGCGCNGGAMMPGPVGR